MCTCDHFPTPHNPGWCALEARPVSDAAWNEFERMILNNWADNAR